MLTAFVMLLAVSFLIQALEAATKPVDSVVSVSGGAAIVKPYAYIGYKGIVECSGLQWFDGAWWTHNDSGSVPCVYRSTTIDFADAEALRVPNATAIDWEELAILNGNLLICDTGGNRRNRTDLKLYEVKYLAGDDGGKLETVASYRIAYPDGKHDCEAVFSAGNKLHMIIKNRGEGAHNVYRFDELSTSEVNTPKKIGAFNMDVREQATAADYDGQTLAVLTYTHVYTTQLDKLFDKPDSMVIEAKQCEAIAWKGDSLFYANEQRDVFKVSDFNKRKLESAQPSHPEVKLPRNDSMDIELSGDGEGWKDQSESLALTNLGEDEYFRWSIVGANLMLAGRIKYSGSQFTTSSASGNRLGAGLIITFNPKPDVFAEDAIRQFCIVEDVDKGIRFWQMKPGNGVELLETRAKTAGSTNNSIFKFEVEVPLITILAEGQITSSIYCNMLGRNLHEQGSIYLANDRLQNIVHPYTWSKVVIGNQ